MHTYEIVRILHDFLALIATRFHPIRRIVETLILYETVIATLICNLKIAYVRNNLEYFKLLRPSS